MEKVPSLKVAIIGAGSAGLTTAKQILAANAKFGASRVIDFTIYERRGSKVGGIWQYDDQVEPGYLAWESNNGDLLPVNETNNKVRGRRLRFGWQGSRPPGPMFDGLRTNIPSDLMAYRDAPFSKDTSLFPSRHTVQEYLEEYADKHNLLSHIQFNTSVVCLKKDAVSKQWLVKTQHATSSNNQRESEKEERFSHVAVCQGRCNTPNIPNIPGLETFTGTVMHSAWYRDPNMMKKAEKNNVLVVGNASSGMDIARELSGYLTRDLPSGVSPLEWKEMCKKDPFNVHSSWHSLEKSPPMDFNPLDSDAPEWCQRIKVVDQIHHINGKLISFNDGIVLDNIQIIIFATGFLFDNPFIDQSNEPFHTRPLLPPSESPSKRGFPSPTMYNLDDWFLFHSRDESIAFLGLPITVVPFPFTEAQASFVIHRWLGMVEALPRLNTTLPPNDANRWSSRPHPQDQIKEEEEKTMTLETSSHIFGHPSDVAYINALMTMLHSVYPEAGLHPPWQEEYKSDGAGNGAPKGFEGKYACTQWRVERRTNGKKLRRETLGY